MTYARARLWVGISGVGFWVLLSLAGIAGQWGSLWQRALRPSASSEFSSVAIDLAIWLVVFTILQAPFDWLGGTFLPARYQRVRTSFAAWLRGTLVMGVLWWLGALSLFVAGQRAGLLGALAVMAAGMLVLLLFQGWLAQHVGGLTVQSRDQGTILLAARDRGFTGGWAGFGPWRRLAMPTHWPKELRAVQTVRRLGVLQSGSRAKGVAVAFAFNLAGLAVSYTFTPGAGFGDSGQYLHLVFGFTLWSFLGLLTLPSLTRPAVFVADRFAQQHGVDWQTAAQAIDQMQDDELARSPWIERIFHPIPSLQSRLASPPSKLRTGAWQAARLALYLGALVPGLLARSVHCNAGRPELWVLYPAD